MSALSGLPALAAAHLALCVLVLAWNLVTAGRIASRHAAPLPMSALSAVAGLLIAPALVILLANDSVLTSRALSAVAWAWPVTAVLVAAQVVYALSRGLVAPAIGLPLMAYDLVLAVVYGLGYLMSHGVVIPEPLLSLPAAETRAIALSTGVNVLLLPYFLFIPILAPASRRRRGVGTIAGGAMGALAAVWTVLLITSVPASARAVHSYDRYVGTRLQERPDSDFTVGLKIFPTLRGAPAPLSFDTDMALADSLGVAILSVYIAPRGASAAVLDSLAHTLDEKRSAMQLIVALQWDAARPTRDQASRERYFAARLADVARIARHLHPDYLVPVLDPTGEASAAVGAASLDRWEHYLRDAAGAAHRADSGIKVMVHVGGFGTRDSTLYSWAVDERAVDAVGLSLSPGYGGGATLDGRTSTLDRWLAATPSRTPQWILEASGFPRAYGEVSQARALWGMLAWATSHRAIKGVVLFEASDYASPRGLRAPGGRLRLAAGAARQAIRALNGS
jgi:hypothetical protein